MERIISRIGGLIVSPKATVKLLVHEKRGLTESLFFVLIFGTVRWITLALAIKHLFEYLIGIAFFIPIITTWFTSFTMVIGVIIEIIIWALLSVAIYFLVKLMQGGGEFEDTMAIIGYAYVARFFEILPLASSPLYPITSLLLYVLFKVIGTIWFVYIASVGVSEVHGISFGKALLAVIVPLLALFLVILIPALYPLISSSTWWRCGN